MREIQLRAVVGIQAPALGITACTSRPPSLHHRIGSEGGRGLPLEIICCGRWEAEQRYDGCLVVEGVLKWAGATGHQLGVLYSSSLITLGVRCSRLCVCVCVCVPRATGTVSKRGN